MIKEVDISLFTPHDGQKSVLENVKRFNVLMCARRFGKSELITSVYLPLISPAVFDGKIVGMFVPVLKDFSRRWKDIQTTFAPIISKVDNSKNIIWFKSGGELYVWSLHNKGDQENGVGWFFKRVIYDETQKIPESVLKHHWTNVVRPTLTDEKGDAYFLGTPRGKNTYFYKLAQRGALNGECTHNHFGQLDLEPSELPISANEEWMTFRKLSIDNPKIELSEVESAKSDMDYQTWLQEYWTHIIDYAGQVWCYSLMDLEVKKKVVRSLPSIQWFEPIYLCFDFNKVPMTCVLIQKRPLTNQQVMKSKFKTSLHVKKEFRLGSKGNQQTIYDTCKAIKDFVFSETGKKIGKWDQGGKVNRYPCPFPIAVTGDASGNTTSGMVKDPKTYYSIIVDELGISTSSVHLPKKNPYHADSWLQVNTMFQKCPEIGVDEKNCPYLVKDMLNIKDDGKHGLAKAAGEETQADLLDCLRYGFNTFFNLKQIRII